LPQWPHHVSSCSLQSVRDSWRGALSASLRHASSSVSACCVECVGDTWRPAHHCVVVVARISLTRARRASRAPPSSGEHDARCCTCQQKSATCSGLCMGVLSLLAKETSSARNVSACVRPCVPSSHIAMHQCRKHTHYLQCLTSATGVCVCVCVCGACGMASCRCNSCRCNRRSSSWAFQEALPEIPHLPPIPHTH
jgi:hypothetical protein